MVLYGTIIKAISTLYHISLNIKHNSDFSAMSLFHTLNYFNSLVYLKEGRKDKFLKLEGQVQKY